MSPKTAKIIIAFLAFVIVSLLGMIFLISIVRSPTAKQIEETASSSQESSSSAQSSANEVAGITYPIVDTGQIECYNNTKEIDCGTNSKFATQDADITVNQPSYTDNNGQTTTDNVTGLVWQRSGDINGDGTINVSDKLSQAAAVTYCNDLTLGGISDWRLPDIKTLYSLMSFYGSDATTAGENIPFINTDYFEFGYGDTSAGERAIDSQWATTSIYVDTVMGGQQAMFGLNLADGRIKGYPTQNKTFYVKCVSGNEAYGQNDFTDNNDGTISDSTTGLTWQQQDSEDTKSWQEALSYCNALEEAGYSDWRLPDAKELHSIVDYTRSPATTNSAAIDELFAASSYKSVLGETDWGYYWTSTTHATTTSGASAVYISFGRALGYMNGSWLDVHGAGAQRSDPKVALTASSISNDQSYQVISGNIAHGPQGDLLLSDNYVRCVRGESTTYSGETVDPVPNSTNTFQIAGSGQAQASSSTPTQSSTQDGAPSEAIAACNSKNDGATCSFSPPNGSKVSGTCRNVGSDLACVP